MNAFSLETFHDVSSGNDFRNASGMLLNEFRPGKIADIARLLDFHTIMYYSMYI